MGYGLPVGSTLLIGSINAYHVSGALLAIWAVVVSIVGIRVKSFPRDRRQASIVAGISIALVISTISTAIIEGVREADKEAEEEAEAAEPAAETTPPAAGEKLALAADPSGQLKFDRSSLEAQAGPVTIDMKNDSPVPHDVSIEGGGVDERGKEVADGGTSTVTADLMASSYTFYCSVPGHREAGMEGKLTVR